MEVAVELLDAVLKQVVEPVPVLITHQAVPEYPTTFVVPQMQQRGFVLRWQKNVTEQTPTLYLDY